MHTLIDNSKTDKNTTHSYLPTYQKIFPNARKITTDTFFLGTSPVITEEQLDYIEKVLLDFFNK
jgi:hypothetical protein